MEKTDFNNLKTPEELMEYMNEFIQYGWIGKDGSIHINELKGLRELYKISSIDEMIDKGVGTCVEQANMIKTALERMGFETRIFCHRSSESEQIIENDVHMHCLVYFKNNDKWYHFEHSNQSQRGIYEYNTLEEGVEARVKRFEDKGEIRKMTEIPYIPVGLSFGEFNQFVNQFDEIKKL